ncbi:MAG: hypothetical protein WDZ59_02300 [Pirellulales bacterium]
MGRAKRRGSPKAESTWASYAGRVLEFFVGPGRRLVFLLIVIATVAGGWYVAWQRVEDRVLDDPRYLVQIEDIHITKPEPWIRADVRGEVIRNASLDGAMSILDPQLSERIAEAFEFHPWVESVASVTKAYGPRIDVGLVYRRPVAMVEVVGRQDLDLVPVDLHAVRLPGDDFSPIEKRRYPRLSGISTEPLVGQRWNDPRVHGGVWVAQAVIQDWEPLRLSEIIAEADPDRQPGICLYWLVTRGGRRIAWGHAPGQGDPGELSPEEKVARLNQFAQQHGSLDAAPTQQTHELQLAPIDRTAAGDAAAGSR